MPALIYGLHLQFSEALRFLQGLTGQLTRYGANDAQETPVKPAIQPDRQRKDNDERFLKLYPVRRAAFDPENREHKDNDSDRQDRIQVDSHPDQQEGQGELLDR